ncbi:MAG: MlaD family protein [Myxococcaceae bacterium]
MNRRGIVASLAIALLGTACGDPELKARLDDASGISEGAPVFANGVQVGKVKSIAVQGDAVEVAFTVEKKHHLMLHADACALALPVREQGSLYVRLGSQGELEKGKPLPQCHLVGDAIRSAVKEIGGAMNDALDAFISKVSPPQGSKTAPCPLVSARLLSVHEADGDKNATRVQVEVINDSDTKVTLPAVHNAAFLDEKWAQIPVADGVGGSLWFMSFGVQPHAKSAAGVVLGQKDAKPKWLEADLGYGFLDSCKVSLELKGP